MLLSQTSQIACAMIFPIWFFRDARTMWWSPMVFFDNLRNIQFQTSGPTTRPPDFYFIWLIALSGFLSFMQNLCAFSLIHQLTTLSYSVSNAAKRIAVILLSLVTLKNPVTPLNFIGMMISIVGVFIYNRVKHKEHNKNEPFFRKRDGKTIFELGKLKSTDSDVRYVPFNFTNILQITFECKLV